MEAVLEFFSQTFSSFAWLAVLIVAMLPIAEAKVAIPFGMATEVWGSSALSPLMAGMLGFIGSMIPAFFIIPFLKPIFAHLKRTKLFRNLIINLEEKFKRKNKHRTLVYSSSQNDNLQKRSFTLYGAGYNSLNNPSIIETTKEITETKIKPKTKFTHLLTLLFFVAIPLPLAGVWTSSAVAAFGDMNYWQSIGAIAIGNLIEVVFVTIVCIFLIDSIAVVLLTTLILVFVYILAMIIHHFVKKRTQKAV